MMEPVDRSDGELRISNADRDRVSRLVQDAAAEGRLTLDEAEQRLIVVYAAKTAADLEPATRGLPVSGKPAPARRASGRSRSRLSLALLGLTERKGMWTLARQHVSVAIWGRAELDLRQVRVIDHDTAITAVAFLGAVEIVVPRDVSVEVNGVGLLGRFAGAGHDGPADAPVIRVRGLALWGAVIVVMEDSGEGSADD